METDEMQPEIPSSPKINIKKEAPATADADVHWRGLYFVNTVVWTALLIVCVAGSFRDLTISTGVLGGLHYLLGIIVYIVLRMGQFAQTAQPHNESTKESPDAVLFKTFVWFIAHILNMGLWAILLIVLWALHENLVLHLFVLPIFLLDIWLVAKYHEIVQRNSSQYDAKTKA